MKYRTKYAKPSTGDTMMRIAFLLLCLVIISVYMMGGLLAKYTANGSGDDSARVAKFDVKVTGTAEDLVMVAANTVDAESYQIRVKNDSEVAVRYTIHVTIEPGDENSDGQPDFASDDISCVIQRGGAVSNEGTLAVGAAEAVHTLTFTVVDWAAVTQFMTGTNDEVSFTFTVNVNVEQID